MLGQIVELTIEKMAIGGSGVSRHNGLVVFVPRTAPKEIVKAKIIKYKKNFAEAELVEIVKPSPFRITPPCPVAGECGGCNWQHIDQTEQMNQKKILVMESLNKFIKGRDIPEPKIFPSPKSFNYRNRIQLKYLNGELGFFAKNSHKIVNTNDCLICEEKINFNWNLLKEKAKSLSKQNSLVKIEAKIDQKEELQVRSYEEEADTFGFSQVNRFQNRDLIHFCIENIKGKSIENFYDLYAGSGNFTEPILHYLNISTTAVELNEKLVKRAKTYEKLLFICADVEDYLNKNKLKENSLIVIDPPRSGANEFIISKIAESIPKTLVYISCHPVSLARDLNWFFTKTNKKYKISSLGIFEMFPQTDHVETIIVLDQFIA